MAQFTVNTTRIDPYRNFKFRVKWQFEPDGPFEVVAGVSPRRIGRAQRNPSMGADGYYTDYAQGVYQGDRVVAEVMGFGYRLYPSYNGYNGVGGKRIDK